MYSLFLHCDIKGIKKYCINSNLSHLKHSKMLIEHAHKKNTLNSTLCIYENM